MRGPSGKFKPRLNKITDSNTPKPPGAAGTIRPIIHAKEKEEINWNWEVNEPIENAFIQQEKPRKRKRTNVISINSGLYG